VQAKSEVVFPHIFPIPLSLANPNMAGSDSSVRGGNHGDDEPPCLMG
jgi:hypothetical protein